jgi:hypothetical protein
MRVALPPAVSVAGAFVVSICSLELLGIAGKFNEMPALYTLW